MPILTLFLDGIGLGADDPATNPFASAATPTMQSLSNGKRWLATTGQQRSERAIFIPTDACLGLPGYPQSGTGQASLLTGINIPRRIGRHYGPKPDAKTRQLITQHSYFRRLRERGQTACHLTAYPPRLLADFARGKTLRSSIQQAAYADEHPHHTLKDLREGRALTAEWTTDTWRERLKLGNLPRYSLNEAGILLVRLAQGCDFALHSHWLSDHLGHRGPLAQAVALLERFDALLSGVLQAWDWQQGLVVITSDHGNMEDLSTRRHTRNLVPTVVYGRQAPLFAADFRSLTDFVPACERLLAAPGAR